MSCSIYDTLDSNNKQHDEAEYLDDRLTNDECAVTVFFPNTLEGRTAASELFSKLSKERHVLPADLSKGFGIRKKFPVLENCFPCLLSENSLFECAGNLIESGLILG